MSIHETDRNNEEYSATYCPEDNKLRLYCGRVHRDTYDALTAAGFKSTPKQSCDFVATWSISAEDLIFELIPEDRDIEDEDYSPEERAADRAERFAGYRDKRRAESMGHAGTFNAGPSVFGNQNAARAERAAARHNRHRDRSLCQWSKAEYWQQRTAGVISHALHKSSPAVRRKRIIRLESELRGLEKSQAEFRSTWNTWKKITEMEGADQLLPKDGSEANEAQKLAYRLANRCTLERIPHPTDEAANAKSLEVHHYYKTPGFSTYNMLTQDEYIRQPFQRLTPKQVGEAYTQHYRNPDDPECTTNRAIEHLRNRLLYENAMLGNEGGRVADVEMVVGGWIHGGHTGTWLEDNPGGWQQILKVSKSPATKRVTSVKVLGVHRSAVKGERPGLVTINVERMPENSYRPPAEGDIQKAAQTLASITPKKEAEPPLLNLTLEESQRLQDYLNANAIEQRKAKGRSATDYTPSEVSSMTQARYTAMSRADVIRTQQFTVKGYTFRIRTHERGVFTMAATAPTIIHLTDKPAGRLPISWDAPQEAQQEAAEPAPVGQLF